MKKDKTLYTTAVYASFHWSRTAVHETDTNKCIH